MATTTTAQSIPVAKKRAQGLSVTTRAITNSSTPLSIACFYGLLILLILAPIYHRFLHTFHLDDENE